MGDTKIEWSDAVWNPVTGCDRCSPGCDNCYALTLAKRLKAMGSEKYQTDGDPATSGPGFGVQCHPGALEDPLRWRKPRRVFVNSMSDLFHPAVPTEFIVQVFAVMAIAYRHTFQVLTKRPQRMRAVVGDPNFRHHVCARMSVDLGVDVEALGPYESGEDLRRLGRAIGDARVAAGLDRYQQQWPLPNVWLGTSIESDRYTFRADHLRNTPAAVRFISAEPLLGPLTSLDLTGIDWLICGGESGPGARPMHPDWARDLRDRCQLPELNDAWPGDRHTRFFFKQWGSWTPNRNPYRPNRFVTIDGETHAPDGSGIGHLDPVLMSHGSKAETGRELDGVTWDEFPAAAR